MKAKHTRRTISIIHTLFFTILIAFFIGVFTLLIWIKHGISIDELTLFDYKFEKLYIKWNKKILIQADRIEISAPSQSSDVTLPNINILLRLIRNTIESIEIKDLTVNKLSMQVHYQDNKLYLHAKRFELLTQYHIEKSTIVSDLFDLSIFPWKLHIQGDATIKKRDNKVLLNAQFDIQDHAYGLADLQLKNNRVSINFHTEAMKHLDFLKSYFNIGPKVVPWIFEKLQATDYTITSLRSSFNINRPKEFLLNLHVEGNVNDFSYTFNPNLFPLKADKAHITFNDAALVIKTEHPTYHNKPLDEAEVSILYMISHPYLKLKLHTQNAISEDIVAILKAYRVKLPFRQTQGESNSTIALQIDLTNSKTQWDANIAVKKGAIDLLGNPLSLKDTRIHIKNEKLTIENATITEPRITSTIKGAIDLNQTLGRFDFNITQLNLKLLKINRPVSMQLDFTQKGITLHTEESHWDFLNLYHFLISAHDFTFDKQQTLYFPHISLYDPYHLDAELNGKINFKQNIYDLSLFFNYLNVPLDNNQTLKLKKPFVIETQKHLIDTIEANQSIHFELGKKDLGIDTLTIVNNKDLFIKLNNVHYGEQFKTDASLFYDGQKQSGKAVLNHLTTKVTLTDPALIHFNEHKIVFDINATQGLKLHSKALDIGYANDQNGAQKFYINDLSKLYPYSPFLKKFNFRSGYITMTTQAYRDFDINAKLFNSHINGYINPDKNNTIALVGELSPKQFKATVNNHFQLRIGKRIHATLIHGGLDLEPFLHTRSSEENNTEKASNGKQKKIIFIGKDGYVRLQKNHRLLYDHVQTTIDNDAIYATLQHKTGKAILFFEEKGIELFGEGFTDHFLQALIHFDGLLGGTYDFYFQGNSKHLIGGIKIHRATAKGFAVYNNLLAYFNTIPALLTLQEPGFDENGLFVKNGDILFEKNGDMLSFKTIKLFGSSTNIFGSGSVDLKKQTIDLSLRIFLIKDMGKIISKIPIAGYLLLGDDGSLTTTITISGDLSHPKFGVNLAKDLVMAPVNIIKRTLNLPSKILNWLSGK